MVSRETIARIARSQRPGPEVRTESCPPHSLLSCLSGEIVSVSTFYTTRKIFWPASAAAYLAITFKKQHLSDTQKQRRDWHNVTPNMTRTDTGTAQLLIYSIVLNNQPHRTYHVFSKYEIKCPSQLATANETMGIYSYRKPLSTRTFLCPRTGNVSHLLK